MGLPLTRVKKIMRSEEILLSNSTTTERESSSSQQSSPTSQPQQQASRFMIAAEAPLLMGKACELMIEELTKRAWYHTEKTKRKTLSKEDIHAAVADSDVYDFLIDIIKPSPAFDSSSSNSSSRPCYSSFPHCYVYPYGPPPLYGHLFIPVHQDATNSVNNNGTAAASTLPTTNIPNSDIPMQQVTTTNTHVTTAAVAAALPTDIATEPLEKKQRLNPPTTDEETSSLDELLLD